MKFTTRILVSIFVLLMAGTLVSNITLKKKYDAIDKSDIFWTYNKILEQPFKYLNISGGNNTNIFFERSEHPSVRVLQEWVNYHDGKVKASVKNDTLFLVFDHVPDNLYEKTYLQNSAPVRIFGPELLSVTGYNTKFEMHDAKQKSITVHLSGRSSFELETLYRDLDSISVTESDSSEVKFELSPDFREGHPQPKGKIEFHEKDGSIITYKNPVAEFNEDMSIRSVTADIRGHSILDIGHAQVQQLQLQVSDSSAAVLSGKALQLVK